MTNEPGALSSSRVSSKGRRRWRWLIVTAMLGLVGCSQPASSVAGTTIPATLKDYRILSAVTAVPAGVVSFHLHNRGPSTHMFGVFETDRAADRLPLGTDGLTIDWRSPLLRSVGGLAQIDIGQSKTLVLQLPPGRYVLVCNMEGHYLGGMHLPLVVH